MSDWTADELHRLAEAEELQVASRRDDGTLRPFVTMWVVVDGTDAYVRSAGGPDRPWYRRAAASSDRPDPGRRPRPRRHLRTTEPTPQDAIDAAYHAKYDRYGPNIVGSSSDRRPDAPSPSPNPRFFGRDPQLPRRRSTSPGEQHA